MFGVRVQDLGCLGLGRVQAFGLRLLGTSPTSCNSKMLWPSTMGGIVMRDG